MTEPEAVQPRRQRKHLGIMTVITTFSLVWLWYMIYVPLPTPTSTFMVAPGDSVRGIAAAAHADGYVRSELGFLAWYRLFYSNDPILAGQYTLPEATNVPQFVSILVTGDISEMQTPVTFPEGITVDRMVEIIADSGLSINTQDYQERLADKEGYVFPDTYFVTENTSAEALAEIQLAAMTEALAPLQSQIASSSLTEYEVLILASIIEREANDATSMKMVSGILQNRLAIDMPLQADASIEYVLDKPLSELVPADLRIDSPYNSYLNRGLPPTPIGNPGLTAIMAVLEPTPSDYFYYITGNDGVFYYARTLDEHNRNISRYLR